jgi:bla regulator protein BlaR1
MRRTARLVVVIGSLAGLSAGARAQVRLPEPGTKLPAASFVLVDGREVSADNLHLLAPESIANVEVLKGAAAAAYYGERARDGVIIVNTKNAPPHDAAVDADAPLYIIDGLQVTAGDGKQLLPVSIDSVEIIKGTAATRLYGEQARNGVIVIVTKRGKP